MSETAIQQHHAQAVAPAKPAQPLVREVRMPAPTSESGKASPAPPAPDHDPPSAYASASPEADPRLLALWLENACTMIPGARRAWALLDATRTTPEVSAAWPTGSDGPARARLAEVMRRAQSVGDALVQSSPTLESGSGPLIQVACPLQRRGAAVGTVALECAGLSDAQHDAVLSLVRWSARWLELLQHPRQRTPAHLGEVFDGLGEAFEHADDAAVALAVTTHLAHRLDLERVGLGRVERGVARVLAVSDTPELALRGEYGTLLGRVVNEVAAGDAPHLHRGGHGAGDAASPAHAALAAASGGGDLLSIPLRRDGGCFAVLSFEARRDRPLDDGLAAACGAAANALEPSLALKLSRGRALSRALTGTSRGWRLALLGLAGAALVALGLGHGDYRVLADAVVEGRMQRAVVTPFDGFVADARVRPGDAVKTGQLLATLEDSELKLERRKVMSDREELLKEYRRALVSGDRAEVRVLEARVEQASARLEYVQARLARTRLEAPIDGVVISGDLSRALGAPVERGQVLFEIAPLDDHRIAVQVDERDIRDLSPGQTGMLRLSAMSGDPLPVVVEAVTSVAKVEGGRNTFRVEARLAGVQAPLRPGMQGNVRVDIDSRPRIWLWTHRLVDWLRMQLWSLPLFG